MTEHTTICGISHPFGQLFPTSGQVTHALLSRPPLATQASPSRPFDLHVSCTPPAFILSQDQTLRQKELTFRPAQRFGVCPLALADLPTTLHLLRCSARAPSGAVGAATHYGTPHRAPSRYCPGFCREPLEAPPRAASAVAVAQNNPTRGERQGGAASTGGLRWGWSR
jgi:hypothetical protein